MSLTLSVRFPDKIILTNELTKTQAYKDISQVYPESSEKAIKLIAEFFAQKYFGPDCNFRSEIDKKLSEAIKSKDLVVIDNLQECSISYAVAKALASVASNIENIRKGCPLNYLILRLSQAA